MTKAEEKERERLHRLWATGRATKTQMLRCTELDHKQAYEDRTGGTSHA